MSAADWGIPTPSQGMPITPFATPFQMQGDALAAALDMLKTQNVPAVADQNGRNSLYPSPKQGNRCFRSDMGWEEVYLEAQSTANPGGSVIGAGWYPTSGKLPYFEASTAQGDAVAQTTIAAQGWGRLTFTGSTPRKYGLNYSASTGVLTAIQGGLYSISGSIRCNAGANDFGAAVLLDNDTNKQIGLNRTGTILAGVQANVILKPNQNVSVAGFSTSATSISSSGPASLSARYLGPA